MSVAVECSTSSAPSRLAVGKQPAARLIGQRRRSSVAQDEGGGVEALLKLCEAVSLRGSSRCAPPPRSRRIRRCCRRRPPPPPPRLRPAGLPPDGPAACSTPHEHWQASVREGRRRCPRAHRRLRRAAAHVAARTAEGGRAQTIAEKAAAVSRRRRRRASPQRRHRPRVRRRRPLPRRRRCCGAAAAAPKPTYAVEAAAACAEGQTEKETLTNCARRSRTRRPAPQPDSARRLARRRHVPARTPARNDPCSSSLARDAQPGNNRRGSRRSARSPPPSARRSRAW